VPTPVHGRRREEDPHRRKRDLRDRLSAAGSVGRSVQTTATVDPQHVRRNSQGRSHRRKSSLACFQRLQNFLLRHSLTISNGKIIQVLNLTEVLIVLNY